MKNVARLIAAFCALFALAGCEESNPAPRDASDDASEDAELIKDAPNSVVGDHCGNECLENDAYCWACGSLAYDEDCNCVASTCTDVLPGCNDPDPAGEGEFCGTYFWCDRDCAEGLNCEPVPPGEQFEGGVGDYRRTCQQP